MPENKFPKKDSKGNIITPHVTAPITHTEEHKDSTLMKAAKVFFSEDIDHVTDSIVDEFVKPRAMSFGMDLVKKIKEFLFDSITDFAGSIFFGRGPSGNTYTITILLATVITAIVSLTTIITTMALIIATISHMEPFVMILSVKGRLKVKEKLLKYLTHLNT